MTAADLTPEADRPLYPDDGLVDSMALGLEAEGLPIPSAPLATEDKVRGLLRVIGRLAHRAAGDPRFPEHWGFTPDELRDLAPPLTSIVNRSERLRRAVEKGDYVELAMVLFGWVLRNVDLSETIVEETARLETTEAAETPPAPEGPPAVLGPLFARP